MVIHPRGHRALFGACCVSSGWTRVCVWRKTGPPHAGSLEEVRYNLDHATYASIEGGIDPDGLETHTRTKYRPVKKGPLYSQVKLLSRREVALVGGRCCII